MGILIKLPWPWLYLVHTMGYVSTMGSMLTHILATWVKLVQLIGTVVMIESILSIVDHGSLQQL